MKTLGEIVPSSLTYSIVKALYKENPSLAKQLILSQHDISPSDAICAVEAISLMPNYPNTYNVSWNISATLEITDAEWGIIHSLYHLPTPLKVTAVKFLKEQHGLRLKAAKDICDYIGSN
jgi:hypothetical protein